MEKQFTLVWVHPSVLAATVGDPVTEFNDAGRPIVTRYADGGEPVARSASPAER